jgi:hypothetical protein
MDNMSGHPKGWGRPNPSRLSDCEAIVSKGTYPYTYLNSGTKMPTGPSLLETPCQPEFAFSSRSATKFSRNGAPDKVVGSSSLSAACNVLKTC